MNGRIKELAKQATQKYDRLGDEIPFAQPDLEVFAELIIQECIRACRPELRDMISRGKVSVLIKEHFGMPKDTSAMDAFVAKMLADRWDDISPADYPGILAQVKDLEPIDGGAGTHCYNSVYQIGDWRYDLTYEHKSGDLIDIKKKKD